jgi:hypothetical protein
VIIVVFGREGARRSWIFGSVMVSSSFMASRERLVIVNSGASEEAAQVCGAVAISPCFGGGL